MSELRCTRCGLAVAVLVAPGEYEWVVTAATPACDHEVVDDEFGLSVVPCEHPSATGGVCDSCRASMPARSLALVTTSYGGQSVTLLDRDGVDAAWSAVSETFVMWQERAAAVFREIAAAFSGLSVTMQHVNPALWRLLFKPRRNWKGHGAPRLYALHPWEPLPARGRPRKASSYRGSW